MTTVDPRFKLELRHLRCLLAAVEEQRPERAAARLGIGQEELLSNIGELERELGVAIFEPERPALTVTDAGRWFAGEVADAVASVDRAVRRVRETSEPPARLRIACPAELPLQQLMSFLGALYGHGPGVAIEVAHAPRAECLRWVRIGAADVCLTEDTHDGDAIDSAPLFHGERLVAFLPIGHPQAWAPSVAVASLVDECLLVPPPAADPLLHDALRTVIGASSAGFREVVEIGAGHPRDILLAVAEGRGVALGRASTVRAIADAETIVSTHLIEPPHRMPDIRVAWKARPPDRLAHLVDGLREVAGSLYSSRDARSNDRP